MPTITDLREFASNALLQVDPDRVSSGPGGNYYFVDKSWNTYVTHRYYNSDRSSSRRERKEDDNTAIVILGIITLVLGIFGSMWSLASEGEHRNSLAETKQMAKRVREEGYPTDLAAEATNLFNRLIDTKAMLHQRQVNTMQWRSLPLLGAAGSGALLVLGGYKNFPQCITAGQVSLLASTLFGLGTLGYQWAQKSPRFEERNVVRLSQEFLYATRPNFFIWLAQTVFRGFSSLVERIVDPCGMNAKYSSSTKKMI